jgi:hypothetical protein
MSTPPDSRFPRPRVAEFRAVTDARLDRTGQARSRRTAFLALFAQGSPRTRGLSDRESLTLERTTRVVRSDRSRRLARASAAWRAVVHRGLHCLVNLFRGE